MGIKSTIIIFSSAAFVLFGVLSITLIRTTDLLDIEASRLNIAGESVSVAKEFKLLLLENNRNLFLDALYKGPSRLNAGQERQLRLNNLIETAEALAADKEEISILSDVKEKIYEYLRIREELQGSVLSSAKQYEISSKYVDAAVVAIDRLIATNEAQKQAILLNVNTTNKTANKSAVTLLSISCIILLGIILGGIFVVTRPMVALGRVLSEYASGITNRRAKVKGLKEIQVIANNFNFMASSLEETRNDQIRFIASIAHDLRNPLGSMTMATELLLSEDKNQSRELTEILSRQVENLDRLVGDLIDTTRIESGNLELKTSVEDVGSLIKDTVKLHQQSSRLHNLKIELLNTPLNCKVDRDRISQVMNNLISNALKCSPNGGTVIVKGLKEKNRIIIAVSDQGIGIDQQDLNGIFKPFHRTKATKGTIPGIGLGLSTSRRIIEAHEGSLQVESQPGKGSTFYIVIPCLDMDQDLPPKPQSSEKSI